MFHTIEEAMTDLKAGKPIIAVDDEDRENEGDLVTLSEKVTPEIINFMITHGKGLVCMPITNDLAAEMKLPMMEQENTDPFDTAFTVSVDYKNTTTGISAKERADTIKMLIDTNAKPEHFRRPGHVFPLIAKNGGVLTRSGHTEAAVDLAKLCGAFPSGVICEIINGDGTMARVPDLLKMAIEFDLKIITIKDLMMYRKKHEQHVKREVMTTLPTEYGAFNMVGYTNDIDEKEHIALVKGNINSESTILTRIHSECLTGDVFSSYRCDCGPQLHQSLAEIEKAGRGVLIYMRQEGRGIGLINKLRAYELQDEGLDTVEANEQLGFLSDMRDYWLSAQILKDLGIHQVNLMTNNPAKITALESFGIRVNKRLPIEVELRNENRMYMHAKCEKMGHLLNFHQ
ncbi:bifunctional 3,4-dihydroxy-2-butanone-4-phosphate synthase/GTP cyclohydrolase II [Virgibacillus sp. W0181]|uniref:bifunctional 3,4-dihydroxy-2-butanone-4-phosphate synthase/GTP cyclohydrolase II n=1 Tax=Virgibacillus sp. W0181 TaxID=3391581 RepID=UPI003F44AE52